MDLIAAAIAALETPGHVGRINRALNSIAPYDDDDGQKDDIVDAIADLLALAARREADVDSIIRRASNHADCEGAQ